MIYCVPSKHYPTADQYLEEHSYTDENGFEWRIARVVNGFFVKYCGEKYFMENTFQCHLSDGTVQAIKNTNCIFFQDASFDSFYDMRTILQNGCTDDIWECLEEFFTERFNNDKSILESEIIDKHK